MSGQKLVYASVNALFLIGLTAATHAQANRDGPQFEVASVKQSPSDAGNIGWRRGGPGTSSPEQIRYTNLPLRALIVNAYGLKDYQLIGPGWMETERYDIVANVPPGTTKDDLRIMLQNLMKQRFSLAIRREMRDMAGYGLVVAKAGHHLTTSSRGVMSTTADGEPAPVPKMGRDGFLEIPPEKFRMPGIQTTTLPDRARIVGYRTSLSQLSSALEGILQQPVFNLTGLNGSYDFILIWTPEHGVAEPPAQTGDLLNSNAATAPVLFVALQQQLGLRLERQKHPLEVFVIDHLDRIPTAN